MPQSTPTKEEIKLLIDNALLQNNEQIYNKLNTSIEQVGDRITKTVSEKTETYLVQLTKMAEEQGVLKNEVQALKNKYDNIWSKIAGLLAAVTTLGGLVGFFIAQR